MKSGNIKSFRRVRIPLTYLIKYLFSINTEHLSSAHFPDPSDIGFWKKYDFGFTFTSTASYSLLAIYLQSCLCTDFFFMLRVVTSLYKFCFCPPILNCASLFSFGRSLIHFSAPDLFRLFFMEKEIWALSGKEHKTLFQLGNKTSFCPKLFNWIRSKI